MKICRSNSTIHRDEGDKRDKSLKGKAFDTFDQSKKPEVCIVLLYPLHP
jgi:hypothetical protein